jgi:hypothetical protein
LSDGNEHAGEEVKVTFRGLRSDVPFAVRLRHLLKRALRDWQLRCVPVEDVPAWTDAAGRSPATSNPGRSNGQPPIEREP